MAACGGGDPKIWDVGSPISVTVTAPVNDAGVDPDASVTCAATASDSDHWTQGANSGTEDDGISSYTWSASAGTFPNGNTGASVTWKAPSSGADVTITCTVNDVGVVNPPDTGSRDDGPGSASVSVAVGKVWDVGSAISVTINQPQSYQKFATGAEVTCSGYPSDTDHWTQGSSQGNANDSIASYTWSASAGTWKNGVNTGQSVTWVSPNEAGMYTITLTANDQDGLPPGDRGTRDDAPGNKQIVVAVCTHAHPTNFRQTMGIDLGNGEIFFRYTWDSTSGDKADLAGVEMGEYISYLGWGQPTFWFPDPPFDDWGQDNPYKMTFPPTDAYVDDLQARFGGFSTPYCARTVTASQQFYFHCPTCMPLPTQAFSLLDTISIPRCVEQHEGGWRYRVTKSGLSSVLPLP